MILWLKVFLSQDGKDHYVVRPPLFIDENYSYWKTIMKLFVQTNDYEVWRVIVNGFFVWKKKVGDSELAKEEGEWNTDDIKMKQLNLKAIHILFSALDPTEFNSVTMW